MTGATKSGRWLEYSIRGNNNSRSDFMDTEEGTLERAASVDEVARVVEFLATDLGAFVSGEVMKVDGAMAKL
jgi:3-oxoacyl-[acyl-carrier protein] reductase